MKKQLVLIKDCIVHFGVITMPEDVWVDFDTAKLCINDTNDPYLIIPNGKTSTKQVWLNSRHRNIKSLEELRIKLDMEGAERKCLE